MSIGGGDDDDDISDRLDQLIAEISELNQLLAASLRGQVPEEGDGQDEADLWNVGEGNFSKVVETQREYKQWRIRAANDEEIAPPRFDQGESETYDAWVGRYVDAFLEGYENLEAIRVATGDEGFRRFVQLLVLKTSELTPGMPTVRRELVDIVDPSPGFFGISPVSGNIVVNEGSILFSLQRIWGFVWWGREQPWEELELEEPDAVTGFVPRDRTNTLDVNKRLAEIADERGDLPDEFREFLE